MANTVTDNSRLKVIAPPKSDILADYRVGFMSRQASLIGRKEVLTGKAKFGIFGDGKEVAQLAMARVFRKGDWRSGYYRDQTFMFAIRACDIRKYFAQLYATADIELEPSSGGRQMNSHFSTRYLDSQGNWLNQCMMYNSSSDGSPTASQMGRLLGLAYASKLYRNNPSLTDASQFSVKGNEVAFGTIGDASTSEGLFWETLNAACVLQVPLCMSVWDDGYGISVPKEFQTARSSISKAMSGFARSSSKDRGLEIFNVKAWDYPALVETYTKAVNLVRKEHCPALIHVEECTQPQGHSTSGSHERYKSDSRLAFEGEYDCIKKMREWIISEGISNGKELDRIENEVINEVKSQQELAWQDFLSPINKDKEQLLTIFKDLSEKATSNPYIDEATSSLKRIPVQQRRTLHAIARRGLAKLAGESASTLRHLIEFEAGYRVGNQHLYSSFQLASESRSSLKNEAVAPSYSDSVQKVDGRQVIQAFFQKKLAEDPRIFIIGEDVGKLGGVNLEFEGLNAEFGDLRITDTGIREATILGQGLGAAMRGLRPIVDIQYLDYLLYCFQLLSDDLATLHYRSAGGQIAPVIVRTKGHRLEGIWHTGSPMGTIIHGIRGMHVCVPRNMTQAAGMYQSLLQGDDPALVIEVLNGYRVKEALPDNLGAYRVALGVPEILEQGSDLTLVTYGACVRIAQDACEFLRQFNVNVELIDVQTLLPFDRHHVILESIKKTNALVILDEDVPGGASAYLMQEILETQGAYDYLDAKPVTITAKPHRTPYASDGDYYGKPNAEDIIEEVWCLIRERDPRRLAELASIGEKQ